MNRISRSTRRTWLAAALLLAAVTLFHWRGLRPGYVFLPLDNLRNNLPWRSGPFQLGQLQNPLIGDPVYQFYPFLAQSVASLRAGDWPLWSPQLALGHPLAGDPLAQPFYPVFAALGLAFGPARGLTIGLGLHALLAAGLTYGWLRAAGATRTGAGLGGLTYALSGYLVTWFETPFWVATLSWLPGVLWAFERAEQQRSWRATAAAGVALGLAMLGGQFSFVLTFLLGLGFVAAAELVLAAVAALPGAPPIKDAPASLGGVAVRRWDAWPLLALGTAGLVGGLLAAVQILPFSETLAHSHRAGGAAYSVLPAEQLLTLLVADYFGNPVTTRVYWGAMNYSEAVIYTGVVALLLALAAPLAVRASGRQRKLVWRLVGLGVAALYLAMGGPGVKLLAATGWLQYISLHRSLFLVPLAVAGLAGLSLSQAHLPARGLLALGLAMGALAAAAVAADWGQAQAHLAELRASLIWAGGLLAAALGLLLAGERWPRLRPVLGLAVVALAFVDLAAAGARYNPALPLADLPQAGPVIEHLQARAGPYRVAVRQEPGEILFGPNVLSLFGLKDVSLYSSLLPRDLAMLVRAGDPASMGYNENTLWLSQPSQRLLDLLQASQVVGASPLADPGLRSEILSTGCPGHSAELSKTHPVSGTFQVWHTAINRLDLSFRRNGQPVGQGPLFVRLWQGQARERLVLESTLEPGDAPEAEPVTFFFAPEADAPGRVYEWEVSTEAAQTGLALCQSAEGQPAVGVYGAAWTQSFADNLFVAERLAPLPQAYVVYAAEVIPGPEQAAARVLDDAFDLRHAAIVGEPVGLPARVSRPATPAHVTSDQPTRMTVQVTAALPGLLVLGDYPWPGWQAWVDGQRVPIWAANVIWRGVRVDAGEHVVELRYQPESLTRGLVLTGLGGLLALALALAGKARP